MALVLQSKPMAHFPTWLPAPVAAHARRLLNSGGLDDASKARLLALTHLSGEHGEGLEHPVPRCARRSRAGRVPRPGAPALHRAGSWVCTACALACPAAQVILRHCQVRRRPSAGASAPGRAQRPGRVRLGRAGIRPAQSRGRFCPSGLGPGPGTSLIAAGIPGANRGGLLA